MSPLDQFIVAANEAQALRGRVESLQHECAKLFSYLAYDIETRGPIVLVGESQHFADDYLAGRLTYEIGGVDDVRIEIVRKDGEQ